MEPAPAVLAGNPLAQIVLVCRLIGTKPSLLEHSRRRSADKLPLTVKGIVFSVDVLRCAIESIDANGIDAVPTLDSLAAASSFMAAPAHAGPPPDVVAGLEAAAATPLPAIEDVADDVPAPLPPPALEPPHTPAAAEDRGRSAVNIDEMTYAVVPHRGIIGVHFWRDDDRYVIVNSLTSETIKLDATDFEWALSFDDDGFCCVVECSDDVHPRVLDVCELFSAEVFENADGVRIVKSVVGYRTKRTLLEEACSRQRHANLVLKCSTTAAQDEITVAVFDMSRDGTNVYMVLPSLLELLGIDRAGKNIGSYICHQFPSLSRACSRLGTHGCERTIPY